MSEKKTYFVDYDEKDCTYSVCDDLPPIGWAVFRNLNTCEHASDLCDYIQSVEGRLHALETKKPKENV